MPRYLRFEELPVWQDAARLYNRVLGLMESSGLPLTPGFRNQLDRAALSVSNNIAEGFERATTRELLSFLAIARGSAGEVRSMIAVVSPRPSLDRFRRGLGQISGIAESCARQLTAWAGSIEESPVQGKRHLTGARAGWSVADERFPMARPPLAIGYWLSAIGYVRASRFRI